MREVVNSAELTAWLIEAAVRYTARPLSVPTLELLPMLLPFNLSRPRFQGVSNIPNLDLHSEAPSDPFLALRATT